MGLPSSVISGKPVKKPNAARRNARALASFVSEGGDEKIAWAGIGVGLLLLPRLLRGRT